MICARQALRDNFQPYFATIGLGVERRYLGDDPDFSYDPGLGGPFEHGFRLGRVTEQVQNDGSLHVNLVAAMLEGRISEEQSDSERLIAEWGHIVIDPLVKSFSPYVDDYEGPEPTDVEPGRSWRLQADRDGSNPMLVVASGAPGELPKSIKLDDLYATDPTRLAGYLRSYHHAAAVSLSAEHIHTIARAHDRQALDTLPELVKELLACSPEDRSLVASAIEQFTARVTQWETVLAFRALRAANSLGAPDPDSAWFPPIYALGHQSRCNALPEVERQPHKAVFQTLLNLSATANHWSSKSSYGPRSPVQRFMARPHEFMPGYLNEASHNIDLALEGSSYEPDRFESVEAQIRNNQDKNAAPDCITQLGISGEFFDKIVTLDKGMKTDAELFGVIFHALLLEKHGYVGIRTPSFIKFAELILSEDQERLSARIETLNNFLS